MQKNRFYIFCKQIQNRALSFFSFASESKTRIIYIFEPLFFLSPSLKKSSKSIIMFQESNLSSSRNDSATSASTSTWRMSRSSASGSESYVVPNKGRPSASAPAAAPLPTPLQPLLSSALEPKAKPRLTRQSAVSGAEIAGDDSSGGSSRALLVRYLPTIPSAAESTEVGGLDSVAPAPASTSNISSQLDPSHEESINEDSNA